MEDKWEDLCKTRLDMLTLSVGSSDAFSIMLALNRLPLLLDARKEPLTEEHFSFVRKLAGELDGDADIYKHLMGVRPLHERIKDEVARALGQRWVVDCTQDTLRQVAMCKNSMYHGQLVPINGNLLPIKTQQEIVGYWATQNPLVNLTLFARLVRTLWFYSSYIRNGEELPNNVINDIAVTIFFNHQFVLPSERIYFNSFLRWIIKHQLKYIQEFFVLEPLFNVELEKRCLFVNSKKFCNDIFPTDTREQEFKRLDLKPYPADGTLLWTESYGSSMLNYKVRKGSDSIPAIEYLVNGSNAKVASVDVVNGSDLSYEAEEEQSNNEVENVQDGTSHEEQETAVANDVVVNPMNLLQKEEGKSCGKSTQGSQEKVTKRCMIFIPEMDNHNTSQVLINNDFMNGDPMLSTEQTSSDSINGDLLSNSTMNMDLISNDSMSTDYNGEDQMDELLIDPIGTDMLVTEDDRYDIEILDTNLRRSSEALCYSEHESGDEDDDFCLVLSEDEKPSMQIKQEAKENGNYKAHYSLRNTIKPSNVSFVHSQYPIKRHSFKFKDPLRLRLSKSTVKRKYSYQD